MRERPIIMQGESVRAILAGTKTQTRRVVTPQPLPCDHRHWPDRPRPKWLRDADGWHCGVCGNGAALSRRTASGVEGLRCPYGAPGDRLWVRESFRECETFPGRERAVAYAATDENPHYPQGYVAKWHPSIFMPRWASRLTLEISEVRVQRVQEISEQDAEAEGIERDEYGRAVNPVVAGLKTRVSHTAVQAYRHAWDALNAKRGFPWSSNPWVWAVTFKRVENSRA